jgi:hypothetical protein
VTRPPPHHRQDRAARASGASFFTGERVAHPRGFEPLASAFGAINRGLSEMRDAARQGTLTY